MELKVEIDYGNILCHGCLSTGRHLSTISQEHSDLFHKLRNDDNYFCKIDLQLCWECIAFLNRLKQFQERITTAQSILTQYLQPYCNGDIQPKLKTLSTLKSIHIKTYNIEFNEDDNEVNDEPSIFYKIQYEGEEKKDIMDCDLIDIKTEIECNIKKEYADKEFSDNDVNDNDSDYLPTEVKIEDVNLKQKKIKKEKKKSKNFSGRRRYKSFAMITKNKNKIETEKYVKMSEPVCLSPTEYEARLKNMGIHLRKTQLVYKCNECKSSFLRKMDFLRHTSCFHDTKIYPQKCVVCTTVLTSHEHMTDHWTNVHTIMYKCPLCAEICRSKGEIKKHINRDHSKTYKCKECDEDFGMLVDFMNHYKQAHEFCICDYCNATLTSKAFLIKHINLLHYPGYCKICDRNFKNQKSMRSHNMTTHPELLYKEKGRKETNKELSYCVECDKQFASLHKFRLHIQTSVKHTPQPKERVPCPDCGKIFSRKTFMKNHYKFMHLKVTKNYCEQCDKYYTTGFGLRTHIARFHKKIPMPKDKICDLCGRGFALNKTLLNHRRTHTGERPFQCKYCPAAFAQQTAMKTHQKTHHKHITDDNLLSTLMDKK